MNPKRMVTRMTAGKDDEDYAQTPTKVLQGINTAHFSECKQLLKVTFGDPSTVQLSPKESAALEKALLAFTKGLDKLNKDWLKATETIR